MSLSILIRAVLSIGFSVGFYYMYYYGWLNYANTIIAIISTSLVLIWSIWHEIANYGEEEANANSIIGLIALLGLQFVVNLWILYPLFHVVVLGILLFILFLVMNSSETTETEKMEKDIVQYVASKLNTKYSLGLSGQLTKNVYQAKNYEILNKKTGLLNRTFQLLEKKIKEERQNLLSLKKELGSINNVHKNEIQEQKKKINKEFQTKVRKLKKEKEQEIENLRIEMNNKVEKLANEKEFERERVQKMKMDYQKKLEEIHLEYVQKLSSMEKKFKDDFKKMADDLTDKFSKKFKDTVKKEKEDLLGSVFSEHEEDYTHSEVFEEQLYEEERKKKKQEMWEEEQELKRKKYELDLREDVTNKFDLMKEMQASMKEEVQKDRKETSDKFEEVNREFFRHEKERFELKKMFLDSITKLQTFVESEIRRITQSLNNLDVTLNKRINEVVLKIGQEILQIKSNHLKIVNKFESFETRYEGDMKGIQQQIEGTYLYIDRKAMEAHEYTRAVKYEFMDEVNQLKKADYELAKNLFLVEANLNEKINAVDQKVDKNALIHQYQLEKLSNIMQSQIEKVVNRLNLTENELRFLIKEKNYEIKDFVNKNFNRIENDLFGFRAETREGFYKLDTKIESNTKEFAQKLNITDKELRYLIEEKGYKQRDFVKSNVSKIEKDLLILKNANQESIFQLEVKHRSRIEKLANETGISFKELNHLVVLKNQTLEQLLKMTDKELKKEIRRLETDHEVSLAKTESKWNIRINDMETLSQKNNYEVLKALQNFKGDIMQFQKSVNSMQNQIEKMQLEIQKVGVENDKIKEEARRLIQDAEDRFAQIMQLIRNFDEKTALTRDRLAQDARESLMQLRNITEEQQLVLKEIAMDKKGVELIYNDRMNGLKKAENNLLLSEEKLKLAQSKDRLELKHQEEVWKLQDDVKGYRQDFERERDRANYWSKESKKKRKY